MLLFQFFIICSQDSLSRANVGQVGLASITLYSDAEATVPFCEGSWEISPVVYPLWTELETDRIIIDGKASLNLFSSMH